jgi:hypothetical protein
MPTLHYPFPGEYSRLDLLMEYQYFVPFEQLKYRPIAVGA